MNHRIQDVCFVVTPFLPEHQPALGVSLLAAILERAGIPAGVRYLNIQYGSGIGWDLYGVIGRDVPADLLGGEIVFARAAWGDAVRPWAEYEQTLRDHWNRDPATRLRAPEALETLLDGMAALSREAQTWIDRWTEEILAENPRVVGLTTTFAQTNACLALARSLRAQRSREELMIIMGGANCDATMGEVLADVAPFIDHVVGGEGDGVILKLVADYLDGRDAAPRYIAAPPVFALDELPTPNFDDYFAAAAGTPWEQGANLVAESSRGCWWGQKSHCTFCGLNGTTMVYRSKTPERVGAELADLRERYGRTEVMMADNIVDIGYTQTLFPALARQASDFRIFYETKSNIRKDQLEVMAAGGVVRLQPGIESFSTTILRLMAKGTTRLQNAQMLKWSAELGIDVVWNFLYGFPGESPGEYASMEVLLPLLEHLPAPRGGGRIRIDRFAPYWRTPDRYGITDLRAAWSYRFAFPAITGDQLTQFAYFFDANLNGTADPEAYAGRCFDLVAAWGKSSPAPRLEIEEDHDGVHVVDTRSCAVECRTRVTPAELRMLQAADGVRGRQRLLDELTPADSEAPFTLERLIARGWMIDEGDQVLSLVMNRGARARVAERYLAFRLDGLGLSGLLPSNAPLPQVNV